MSNGAALLASAKARVAADGQILTVRRAAVPHGTAPTDRQVGFLPQPMKMATGALSAEGSAAANDPNRHDFVTPGDSDVRQKDLILAYDGTNWRIQNITGNPIGGIRPWLHCESTRE